MSGLFYYMSFGDNLADAARDPLVAGPHTKDNTNCRVSSFQVQVLAFQPRALNARANVPQAFPDARAAYALIMWDKGDRILAESAPCLKCRLPEPALFQNSRQILMMHA